MGTTNQQPEEARKPVFDTRDLADESVAATDPEKKTFWSRSALKAILRVDLDDDIVPKRLDEADVDDLCRSGLACGLTPAELDGPFNR